jgi:hypothetical protein
MSATRFAAPSFLVCGTDAHGRRRPWLCAWNNRLVAKYVIAATRASINSREFTPSSLA